MRDGTDGTANDEPAGSARAKSMSYGNPGLIFLQREHACAELRSHRRFARVLADMRFPAP